MVASDMSKEEREEYGKLKDVKSQLENNGINAKILKNKLVINDKKHSRVQALEFISDLEKENPANEIEIEGDSNSESIMWTESSRKRKQKKSPADSRINKIRKENQNKGRRAKPEVHANNTANNVENLIDFIESEEEI